MAKRVTISREPYIKALFFGNPGSGKTRLACSACLDDRLWPVLYLNAAGNPESVVDYERLPDIVNMEELRDFNWPYDWFKKGQPENHPFCVQFGLTPPYKTVIIDQLTDVQRMAFRIVLNATGIGPGDFPSKREWSHYNKVLYQMTNFAALYYGLADIGLAHVIMTAQERIVKDDADGSVISYQPLMEGESRCTVPSYAMLVGRTMHRSQMDPSVDKALSKDKRFEGAWNILVVGQTGKIMAKNQYGGLSTIIASPTMTLIMDGIEAHRKSGGVDV